MEVRIHVTGLAQAQAKLAKLNGSVHKAVDAALYMAAEQVATEAKKRVPVKWGTLKNSIRAERSPGSAQEIAVAVVAGDAAAFYAVYVHEDLTARHNTGEAKFIERPMLEMAPKIPGLILDAIKKATG